MDSHIQGDVTEATVLQRLVEKQISVMLPWGDNERYDLVVEHPNEGLLKVQVKTATKGKTEGSIRLRARTMHTNSSGNKYKSYKDGEVDYFALYDKHEDELYWIDADEVGKSMLIRTKEPKKNQPNINWAEDYLFEENWTS